MKKIIVEITGPFITLDNLLKYTGASGSGGQAGQAVTAGLVQVNGQTARQKRKKIYAGDEVSFSGSVFAVTAQKI